MGELREGSRFCLTGTGFRGGSRTIAPSVFDLSAISGIRFKLVDFEAVRRRSDFVRKQREMEEDVQLACRLRVPPCLRVSLVLPGFRRRRDICSSSRGCVP